MECLISLNSVKFFHLLTEVFCVNSGKLFFDFSFWDFFWLDRLVSWTRWLFYGFAGSLVYIGTKPPPQPIFPAFSVCSEICPRWACLLLLGLVLHIVMRDWPENVLRTSIIGSSAWLSVSTRTLLISGVYRAFAVDTCQKDPFLLLPQEGAVLCPVYRSGLLTPRVNPKMASRGCARSSRPPCPHHLRGSFLCQIASALNSSAFW